MLTTEREETIYNPESLYYSALASAASIAVSSPKFLMNQPAQFALDLSFIGYMKLKYFDMAPVFLKETSVNELIRVLELPPHLFRYRYFDAGYWVMTDQTLAFIKTLREDLATLGRRAVRKLPRNWNFSPDAIKYTRMDRFFFRV